MNKFQAWHNFWSSFGLEAYDATTVPDNAQLPYITYEMSDSEFDVDIALTANLWYRSASWAGITQKEMEIAEKISRGGVMVPFSGGAMWIKKGTPFSQRMSDENDDTVRRIVFNVEIEFMD